MLYVCVPFWGVSLGWGVSWVWNESHLCPRIAFRESSPQTRTYMDVAARQRADGDLFDKLLLLRVLLCVFDV